ncbi:rhomboid family intramembrane serine protease [Halomicrococcus gelatinilyticus]|uniref:rhomboid family intramembrane serine protease n=1 Tax=Halomicrococcus gelatinilyticus TaxID=1702103 RepID=UPI002E10BFD1
MSSPFDGLSIRVAIVVGLVASLLVVWALDRPHGRWSGRLRERFLLGVPWGTLVSVAGVVGVYLFVQHGWQHWRNPVTVAFASWSYLYPVGVLLGPFSHGGPGHLLGNVMGTVAVAPLAEYYFSHYPTDRGETSFGSWRTNPWLRAFVLFPLGVGVVGLGTSLLSWGPVIGFSGVLFAFVGFALVRYPIGTVVALSAQGAVRTAYRTFQNPLVEASASSSYSTPWWFGIAIQGHVLGLFLGILAGLLVARRRDGRVPSALRSWAGALLVTMSLSLWALWWYRGLEKYVLYRGLGVVFVLAIATVVAFAVRAHERDSFGGTTRTLAVMLVLLPLVTMAFVAVPVNLTEVQGDGTAGVDTGVDVRGYTVMYAEDVRNQKVTAVDVSVGGETTRVNTSGVIVVNPDREIWSREVTKGRLAHGGSATVRVGGVDWSRAVDVRRVGWSTTGGGSTYMVWLRPENGSWQRAYSSGPATAGPVIKGLNVSVAPQNERFVIRLGHDNETVGTTPVPARNETANVRGIQFTREDNAIYANVNLTRVEVARRENA